MRRDDWTALRGPIVLIGFTPMGPHLVPMICVWFPPECEGVIIAQRLLENDVAAIDSDFGVRLDE